MRQVAVVGQQQQSLACIVEPAHRIDACTNAVQQIHDRRPVFGIVCRGDVSLRLVHQQINLALGPVQQLAIYANVVALGIGLAAEFGDDLSVDRHHAGADQLFSFATGRNSRSSNDFLQTFSRHVWKDYQRVYATFLCATPLWNSVSSVVYFCLILAVKMEEQAVVQGRNHFDDRWREVELMPFSQFGPESYPNVVLRLPFRPPALVSRLPPPPAANRFGTTPLPAFRILPCSAAR